MDNSRRLGMVQVALSVQVVIAPEKLGALLTQADRQLGRRLAEQIDVIVRREQLGYYPALDFFEGHPDLKSGIIEELKTLAAHIRKRVKRDTQTHLWPVFSSVQIERATSLALTLLRLSPTQPDALEKLAQHYFPNTVRLELILGTLDKQHRLEVAEKFSANKVVRHLREVFESVTVTATRRLSAKDDLDPQL